MLGVLPVVAAFDVSRSSESDVLFLRLEMGPTLTTSSRTGAFVDDALGSGTSVLEMFLLFRLLVTAWQCTEPKTHNNARVARHKALILDRPKRPMHSLTTLFRTEVMRVQNKI